MSSVLALSYLLSLSSDLSTTSADSLSTAAPLPAFLLAELSYRFEEAFVAFFVGLLLTGRATPLRLYYN